MKKIYLLAALCILAANAHAQLAWQAFSNGPGTFWDMDTLHGKLYLSGGIPYEYDGSTWTLKGDYNASSNTPNKTKSALKNLNGKLYAGAKDFNTSGKGNMHSFDGSTWSDEQKTNFAYNGNYKVRSFASYNNTVYASGEFAVPTGVGSNLVRWDGNDWTGVGRKFGSFFSTPEISDMEVFGNRLFITEKSNVWAFDGTSWDSLFYIPDVNPSFPMASAIYDMVVWNNALYISGFFYLNGTSEASLLIRYDGSTFSTVLNNQSGYEVVNKLGNINNRLYFVTKRSADEGTYLLSYNGNNISEIDKLASKGDFAFSPGNEHYNYSKLFQYGNDLIIGGNFQKIGGEEIGSIAHASLSTVGIGQALGEAAFSLYPNPAKGSFTLRFSEPGSAELRIHNQNGQLVAASPQVYSGQTLYPELCPGIYFYTVASSKGLLKKGKLIITP